MNKKLFAIFALLIMASNLVPQPVYAATQVLETDAEGPVKGGIHGTGAYVGGATNFTNMHLPDDENATYLRQDDTYMWHYWSFDPFAPAYSAITNVRMTVRGSAWASGSGANTQFYTWVGGTDYRDDAVTNYNFIACGPNTYCDYSVDWANNPADGQPWEAADIDAAYFGIEWVGDSRYTTVYLTVTYDPTTAATVTTGSASAIEEDDAILHGNVVDDGGLTIDRYGFVLEAGGDQGDPGNVIPTGPPGTWDRGWQSAAGDYGENPFQIDAQTVWGGVLTKCTTYTYRACAHNSFGGGTWVYGDAVSFTTLCDPDIETKAATYVEATTARLNSLVLDDGGQFADVRFAYGTTSANCTYNATCSGATCNATSYDSQTAWVNDTYSTGQTPYVDISGLLINTTYYFCAQIRNDVSCRCGGELSFTTPTGVNAPTDLKGIPFSEAISLFWTKGVGSTNTVVRYSLGIFPTDETGADGSTLVYFDVLTSILHTGLTPGETIYYTAWGESGGFYSSSNATLMITTLAATPPGDAFPTPDTPTSWYQSPDHTTMSAFPLYGWYNWVAECFSVPLGTAWFLGAIFLSVLGGVIAYNVRDSHNLLTAVVVTGVIIVIFTLMKLVSLWFTVPYIVLAVTGIMVGERR